MEVIMKPRLIGGFVVAIGMIVLASVAGYAGAKRTEPSADTRQRLVLPRAERDKVLAEMRQMLGSMSGVLHGFVANDMPGVEKAARASGTAMAADPQLEKKLPEAFLQLGMQTHKSFDKLADQAKTGGTREDAIKALAVLSNNCVGCHSAYRLDEGR
jgi:cytochrome c556